MKKRMIDLVKISGRNALYPYTIGIIKAIVGEIDTTAEGKVAEIARTLADFRLVSLDYSLPWNAKKAPTDMGATKVITQVDCNIDVSKVESLMKPWTLEEIMRREG